MRAVMCRLLVDLLGGAPAPAGLRHGASALTDWKSITAAVGLRSQPAAARASSRNRSCKHCRVPQSHQAAMPVIKRHVTRARAQTEHDSQWQEDATPRNADPAVSRSAA